MTLSTMLLAPYPNRGSHMLQNCMRLAPSRFVSPAPSSSRERDAGNDRREKLVDVGKEELVCVGYKELVGISKVTCRR
jgi:hypothetical protein